MKKNQNFKIILIIMCLMLIVLAFYYYFSSDTKKEIQFVFNETKLNLKIGETKKIDYTLNDPELKIVWSSNNDRIVSVDNNGIIKGINYGNATIIGKISYDDMIITNKCVINVYTGDVNVSLQQIDVLEGDLLMMPNSEYDIPFTIIPSNSYITSLEYIVGDENVIKVENDKVISKSVGVTTLSIIVNNQYQNEIVVCVENDAKENKIIKRIESVQLDENDLTLKPGDTKTLSYTIKPFNAYVKSIKWESSDSNVVSIDDGEIKALKSGEATIKLIVNDSIESTIDVNVLVEATSIKIDKYPKTVIKVGEKTTISSHIVPTNASDKTITYRSSNPSVVSVNNGIITGVNSGSSTITLTTINGKTASVTVNVLPSKGIINGTGNLWGYKSLNTKSLIRADVNFFRKLAQSGKGTLQGNVYTYKSSDISFTYYIDTDLLAANNARIKVRIYYPENEDLSTLNTFTYMGGDGEKNFYGLFSQIEKDKSIIKGSGIVILVAEGNNTSFDQYAGIYATKFVQSIINQKSTSHNAIAGFSTGGTKVMGAANLHNYDRVIVFSSYYNWASMAEKLKNKEVMFYVPSKDHLYQQAKTTLNDMRKSGYKNVTIVTNSTELANIFKNDFLVINPGQLMLTGHLSENVIRSGLFQYANE